MKAIDEQFRCGVAHAEFLKIKGSAQLEFARSLCNLYPERSAAWRRCIARAERRLENGLARQNLKALAQAVVDLEKELAPLHATAKSHIVHAAAYPHIDMNWIFSWPETVSTVCDTTITALSLMEEFPEFVLSQDQAAIYQILERFEPEVLGRVRQRVAEGRWEVLASHWVEGDKNLVAGESLVRQITETRAYMKQLFGMEPEQAPVHFCPDTFGHAADIPRFLDAAGIKYYFFARPGGGGMDRWADYKPLFRWRARESSEVMAFWSSAGYGVPVRPGLLTQRLERFVRETGGLREYLYSYGVGDHGGGPTRLDLLYVREMNQWACYPAVRFSTYREYFERMERFRPGLPVFSGELNPSMQGCYTSAALIKKSNRIAENLAADVELFATVASQALGTGFPADTLRQIWRDVLFNQFHDILPGSGIMETRTHMHGKFQELAAEAGRLETRALQAMCRAIDIPFTPAPGLPLPFTHTATTLGSGSGRGSIFSGTSGVGDGWFGAGASLMDRQEAQGACRPYVVFNPAPCRRDSVATLVYWDHAPMGAEGYFAENGPRLKNAAMSVEFADGTRWPAQVLGHHTFWFHNYALLAFPAALPSAGYRALAVREEASELPEGFMRARSDMRRYGHGDALLENGLVRARFNADDGTLEEFTDLRTGINLAGKGFAALEYALERHNWRATAWAFGEGCAEVAPLGLFSLKQVQNGPYVATMEGNYRRGDSSFTVRYELRANDPALYLCIEGKWLEVGTAEKGVPSLRLRLPTALEKAVALSDMPGGAWERREGADWEFPAVEWCRFSGRAGRHKAGILVCTEGKHGFRHEGGTLSLSLIRSSYDPDPFPELGEHRINLSIRPFAGELGAGACVQAGMALNKPLRALSAGFHKGRLPPEGSALSVENPNLVLMACRPPEEGAGLILRVVEMEGRRTRARIRLDVALMGRFAGAHRVDLLGRPVKGSAVRVEGDAVLFDIKPYGIVTVKLNPRTRRQRSS